MRVYLDNCSFNRPFDCQRNLRVRLETEAKLAIQERILEGEIEVVWSYVLGFENRACPFEERRRQITRWRAVASAVVGESKKVLEISGVLSRMGLSAIDALHVACALDAQCDYFITTDDSILKKQEQVSGLRVRNPMDFVRDEF